MTTHKQYKITVKIKVHTSPLYELIYERIGTLLKETQAYYVFNGFRVRKANVMNIQEVNV